MQKGQICCPLPGSTFRIPSITLCNTEYLCLRKTAMNATTKHVQTSFSRIDDILDGGAIEFFTWSYQRRSRRVNHNRIGGYTSGSFSYVNCFGH